MKKIIIVVLLIICSTGCWNYKELTELGLISAMGITKKDDKYILDLQYINIIEAGDKGISEAPITVVSGEGKTIAEAARSINMKSSKINFPSNIEYVFLDPSILEGDLNEVLDFLTRYTKLSLNFLIVTSTTNTSKEILSSLSTFNLNPASNLSELIKSGEQKYGASYSLNSKEFLREYLDYGEVPVYPDITILNENEETDNDNLKKSDANNYVVVNNLVTFDKDGNTIKLERDESLGFNFLKNHITNATITSSCGENKYFTVETLESDFKYDDRLEENKIKVTGEVKAEIFFYGCEDDLDKNETLDKISKLTEEEIKSYIEKTINIAQSNKLDFIGIGNWVYKNKYGYFDFKKKDWNSLGLTDIDFDYDIKVDLFKQGNLKGEV